MSIDEGNEDQLSISTSVKCQPAATSTDYEALQALQAELTDFLVTHTEKVRSLHANLSVSLEGPSNRPEISHAEKATESNDSNRKQPQPQNQILSQAVVYHSHHLKSFLDTHIQNIHKLHDALPHPVISTVLPREPDNGDVFKNIIPNLLFNGLPTGGSESEIIDEKTYASLTEQFNNLVVISTFTASLIVSYISLVKSIVINDHRVPFDVGMLFSFLAMGLHFGNIIVAGRGAALTSQHSTEEDYHNITYFRHYLAICEQLQFFATLIFIVSIFLLTFYIFSSIAFPLTLLAVSVVVGVLVFWSAYWRVSITLRNARFVVRRVHHLRQTRSASHST